MARIINVIRNPHLATYKAYNNSNYRCCAACDYQVIIEDNDRKLIVSSCLDESNLCEFDIDEAIEKESDITHNQDWFYRFPDVVRKEDIDNFVNGQIEQSADKVVESFCDVLSIIRRSHCVVSTSGIKALEWLKEELDKTITNLNKTE